MKVYKRFFGKFISVDTYLTAVAEFKISVIDDLGKNRQKGLLRLVNIR